MGQLSNAEPQEISLADSREFRHEIARRKTQVAAYGKAQKDARKSNLIVLIKPGKKSNYGNLVNVLDEMAISEVPTYAITDLSPEEDRLLAQR